MLRRAAAHVARAQDDVGIIERSAQIGQCVWIMGEVSIHFEHVLIATRQRIGEASAIGRAKTLFAGAMQDRNSVRIANGQGVCEDASAIRRAVVDDQRIEWSLLEYRL